MGCGLVAKLSRETYKRVEARWRYGTFSFLVQDRYDLTAEELGEEVDKLLQNRGYLNNSRSLCSKITEYRGAAKAMELIEKYWS